MPHSTTPVQRHQPYTGDAGEFKPDDQLFFPTVFEDVAFGPLRMGLPGGDEVRARIDVALEAVRMSSYKDRLSHHLSVGEIYMYGKEWKQRLLQDVHIQTGGIFVIW